MKKTILKIICFFLLLILSLGIVNNTLKLKFSSGIAHLGSFYELEPNSVDVLVIGSSHASASFCTGELWKNYGMATYVLAGPAQPLHNTYYYLKEALKYQTPKVIVLESYVTTWDMDYAEDKRVIENNFGLRWSADKLESLDVSTPGGRYSEFFLGYTQYHTRYSDLNATDLGHPDHMYDDWKGYFCNLPVYPCEVIDVSGVNERHEIYSKNEKYYREIIELALERDIPIVVVEAPYQVKDAIDQAKFNTAMDIANEYGVPFINFNLLVDEIGLDYSTDLCDFSHLNYKGSRKFSNYFAQNVLSDYGIPDKRGQSGYETWDRNSVYIDQMISDYELTKTTDLNEITGYLGNSNYQIFMSVDGETDTSAPELAPLLLALGINDVGKVGIWNIDGGQVVWYSQSGEGQQFVSTDVHDFELQRCMNPDGTYTNLLIVDRNQKHKVDNGVNIIVYDKVKDQVADIFGINADDNYSIVR